MVMEPILWLQSYLELLCKAHNLVGRLEAHEENAHLPEPSPPHRKTSDIQDRSEADESQRSRLIQAMPKLSLTFSLLARSGPFLSFEKVALWN